MEDLYDDLENYNEVNLMNELKTENAELKQKLGECLSSMHTLQKDFDKLAADFKVLETNYSSLLIIARAEIKRKTDMITNLNVEKDMLVLKQFKPEDRKNKFRFNNVKNSDRDKKKNSRSNVKYSTQSELNSKESKRLPSEGSSTVTDKSNRLTIVENRNVTKHNENHREDVFPDRSGDYNERFMDRRVSMLASHQFTKFSSDEEFEDMYSALEPKPSSKESSFKDEPERGRKRMRDDEQHAKAYYETFKDRDSKNRNSQYENDRSVNRDQYDIPHRNKYSPERHRRGKREFAEVRHVQQRDRQRRLERSPRGRYQHKSRERRSYPDRERVDQKAGMQKYRHPDNHAVKHNIHGVYDEPLNKRQRVEHYPHPGEDRRQSDRQILDDQHPTEVGDYISCQSPDNLHSEHMPSNEPIREIKSTAMTTLEDPRVSSGKYLRCTDGNKDILCTLNSNKVNLQPVNKALWELNKDKPQQSLTHQLSEISSELVNEIYMDIDNPLPNLALESKDGTDVTDYLDEGLIVHAAAEKIAFQSAKNDNKDKSVSKHAKDRSNEEIKEHKSAKCKISKVKKADKLGVTDEPSAKSSSKAENTVKASHRSKHIESSLQQKQLLDINTESVIIHDTSKSMEEKEKNISLPDLKKSKTVTNVTIQREFEHKVYSIKHIVEGDLELSDETNDETQAELLKVEEQVITQKKHRTRKKSQRDSSKEKPSNVEAISRKTRPKKEELKPSNKFNELFGDSSSLITPEDLALATTQAHARAGGYVPVCEDAQDAIHINNTQQQITVLAQTTNSQADENKIPNTNSTTESSKEEKKKAKVSKDIKTRTHPSKHKKLEHTFTPHVPVKDLKEDGTLIHINKEALDSAFKSTAEIPVSRERSDKETCSAGKPAMKSKGDEETKEPAPTDKKSQSNEDKTLLSTKSPKKSFANKNATKAEFKKSMSISENKENDTCKDSSKENSSVIPQFFNDTLVPNENTFNNNKTNEEKLIVKSKETICGARIEEIPNLVPEKDERGLVKTVVISTGVQPSDLNLYQLSTTASLYTPLKALATSTPAKELSTSNTLLNTFDQTASNVNASCVNGETNENGESQNETDVPDVRINYYRRRRKVWKKSITG